MTERTIPPTSSSPRDPAAERRGLWLGLLGVAVFALTTPMTRLAVGPLEAPQLPPLFVTAGRAAGAALLSLIFLVLTRAAWPTRAERGALLLSAAGTVLGFPLCLAMALREVPSMHASVITGLLPLCTAAVGAWHLRQRPSRGFWICALAGAALVLGFFAWYRGLALGGLVRVSQVQMLQPFLALLAAVPLLGEPLQADTLVFALAVMVCVGIGRTMPVGRTPPRVLAVPSTLNRSEPEGHA